MKPFKQKYPPYVATLFFALINSSFAASVTVQSPETINAVIELYTSEGCSSCPPADKWISSYPEAFTADGGVVALAFHVDYWNYLGWEDVYSKPEFTARQRSLGSINNQRTIYTPEFFVNASETRRANRIPEQVSKINGMASEWNLTLTSSTTDTAKNTVLVELNATPKTQAVDTELYIALYENSIERIIKSGENKNKTLHHDFVVRDWIGPISFNETHPINYSHSIELPSDALALNTGIAAILVEPKSGKTLQAVKSDLSSLFRDDGK